MKNTITLLLLIITSFGAHAQDLITKKNGDDIKAKVLEVTQTEIKYKKFESQSGVTYTINKSDVLMIRYQDGTKDIFSGEEQKKAEPSNISDKKSNDDDIDNDGLFRKKQTISNTPYVPSNQEGLSMAERGRRDAKIYYRGYKGASSGTFWVSCLTDPVLGLIPAIACSKAAPRGNHLGYPDYQLMKNSDYGNAYREKAHSIKKKKTWIGYAIGASISTIIIVSVVASMAGSQQ